MLRFQNVITLYMIGEMYSAWGLWVIATICAVFLAKCVYKDVKAEQTPPKRYQYLFFTVLAFLLIGLALMWHSMREQHAIEVRQILNDAYMHPELWGARK